MIKKLFIILTTLLLLCNIAIADVTLPLNTSFDCQDQSQEEPTLSCDGLDWILNNAFFTAPLTDGGATDLWTQSSTGTEYYYTGALLGIGNEVDGDNGTSAYLAGVRQTYGTVGALTSGKFGWGNNGGEASADTMYIYSTVDPDTLTVLAFVGHAQWATGDYKTAIKTEANNPLGTGKGVETWNGDGWNVGTGSINAHFSTPQKELWVRVYIKYEVNFAWEGDDPVYDKIFYIYTDGATQAIPDLDGDEIRIASQGSGDTRQVITTGGGGWPAIMGGALSDGDWHPLEFYQKMDTDTTDGIGRIFLDGVIIAENTAVNWSGGDATSQLGWVDVLFPSNQAYPLNGEAMSIYYDDVSIYGSTPPNLCDGESCIGLLPAATNPVVVLQADFSTATSPTTYTGTATAETGRTVVGVVSSNGYTVTPDDGTWDELEEAFTVSGVIPTVTDTCTATDSSAETGQDSITVTLTPETSGTTKNGFGSGKWGR